MKYVDRFDNGGVQHRGPFLTPPDAPRSNWEVIRPEGDEPYLKLTVWHELNAMHPLNGIANERTEYTTPYFTTPPEGQTFHYGFHVHYPRYRKISGRHLLTQFKVNMKDGVNPSPLVGIYLEAGGQRNLEKIKVCHEYDYASGKCICENHFIEEGSEHYPLLPPGEWITLKLSTHVSKGEDGWVKIYKNGSLVWDYSGPTNYRNTVFDKFTIRFGLYRDRNINGPRHDDAEAHFRNFAFSTDEALVDHVLAQPATGLRKDTAS